MTNIVKGSSSNDYLSGTSGDDTINAGAGQDVINGSAGNDVINGGDSGYNQIDYTGAAADYTFTQNTDGTVTVGKPGGGVDTISDISGFWFSGSAEWKPLSDLLSTGGNGGGSQTINGTSGDDYLSGTSGDDTINAGTGQDVINGSAGNDVINGGDSGYNQIDYAGAPADYTFTQNNDGTVTVGKPDGGVDTISDIGGFWFAGSAEWCSLEHVLNTTTNTTDARNDAATADSGEAVTIKALINDFDAEGDAQSITNFSQAGNGSVELVNGKFVYTSNDGFSGQDWFSYEITDANGATDTATVDVVVNPAANPVNAKLIGSQHVKEGLENSEQYKVELDRAVTEDTWVTIDINSETAQQTDGTGYEVYKTHVYSANGALTLQENLQYVSSEGIKAGINVNQDGLFTYNKSKEGVLVGIDELKYDYLVHDSNDVIVDGDQVKVLIKAGESTSSAITIKANIEIQNLYGSSRLNEGNETFSLSISDLDGVHFNSHDLQVTIKDVGNYISPIALDLNGDGEIGVTGETSSIEKDGDAELGRTVEFDIDADGDLDTIEWFDGSGDGILIDTSKIGADGSIDGSALFGDEGGKYANGYENLKSHDTNNDGMISGAELEGLGLWIDDGDAVLEAGEMKTAAEAGVESVSTEMEIVMSENGRELMRSEAEVNGETVITEDVWFAEAADEIAEMEAMAVNMNHDEILEDCVLCA